MHFLNIFLLVSLVGSLISVDQLWAADSAEGQLFAQKKTKAKKKIKSEASASEGTDTLESETSHEGFSSFGKGSPYIGEIGVSSTGGYTSKAGKSTPEDGDSSTSTGSKFALAGEYLFILWGRWGVGPRLEYRSSSTETEQKLSANKTEKTETTETTTNFGLANKVYFGTLSKDQWIPYGRFTYTLNSGSSKSDSSSSAKISGTTLTLGGGVHFFVASRVALMSELFYQLDDKKTTTTKTSFSGKDTSSTSKSSGSALGLGFGVSMFL